MPELNLEASLVAAGFAPIAGVDEAGRGACAGPIVAAAVILDAEQPIAGLADSKKLTALRRERLFDEIYERALAVSVTEVSAPECDRLGLQSANLAALRRAVLRLEVRPGYVLCDGFAVDGLDAPSLGVWKGDQVAACISAASIVAKVTRDRIMVEANETHPGYGFAKHKGYGTAEHYAAIVKLGVSDMHRRSFANVAQASRVRNDE